MSADERVIAYTDDFQGHLHNTFIADYPPWLGLSPTPSPIVYLQAPYAVLLMQEGTQAAAIIENNFPNNQYARFNIGVTTAGTGGVKNGAGVLLRLGFSGPSFWHYQVMVNGSDNSVTIYKVDTGNAIDVVLASVSHTPAQFDPFFCEVETISGTTCEIRVYDKNETIIAQATDSDELSGVYAGVMLSSQLGGFPSIDYIEFGTLDIADNRSLDTVNPDGVVKANGPITLTGSGFSGITGGHISDNGARQFPITITNLQESVIQVAPIDVVGQSSLDYGTMRMTLTHSTDPDLTKEFTLAPEDGWQAVVLAGATDNTLLLTDTVATDGDTMEIPTNNGFSDFTLNSTGDVTYDSAVNQGTQHTRRLYDNSTNTWDSGTVTINQIDDGGGELLPPSWRSTPSPPNAVVGTYYRFEIGYLIDGSRPMTLSQAPGSNSLPFGLAYNSSSYPETIEGTITSGTGTVTVSNIVTRASNGVG